MTSVEEQANTAGRELFNKRVQAWAEADARLETVLEHRLGHPCWVNRSEDGKDRRPPAPEVVVR